MEHDRKWLEKFLQYFYRSCLIPVCLCRKDELLLACAPSALPLEPAPALMKEQLQEDAGEPFFMAREDFLFGAVPLSVPDLFVTAGPVTGTPATLERCRRLLQDFAITEISASELRFRIDKSPLITRARFISVLRFLKFGIDREETNPSETDCLPVNDQDSIYLLRQPNPSAIHNTLTAERAILSMIKEGRSSELLAFLPSVNNAEYSSGLDFEDPLEQTRTVFITAAALCSRAAILGGMDYEKAVTRSDDYLRQVRSMKSAAEILPFVGIMMIDYAQQVERLKTPEGVSPVTKAAVKWVQGHLEENIRISEMADRLGFSPSYLSHAFSKDMGTDLKSYIQKEKIEEARRLLSRGKSIQDTAQALSFSSVSHFQTAFKKLTGMTPREFQKSEKEG